ncbi:MAG: hypothetical protein ACTJHW_00630 [Paenalcaligenes sp.]
MKVLAKSLLAVAASLMLASCGTLTSLTSALGSANNEAVAGAHIAETIKTKDLYGAWAVADDDPVDFLYVVVLMPNHNGVNYFTIDEKDGKPASEYTDGYTWEFNEKDKIFTSHTVTRSVVEKGQPENYENIDETDSYQTTMYMMGKDILAIKFTKPGEEFTFLRMDNETYQKLVKSVPGLPSIK